MSDARSRLNTFSGHYLNRCGELRTNADALAHVMEDANTRFVLVSDQTVLIHERPTHGAHFLNAEQINAIAPDPVAEIYLGEFGDRNIFARVVEGDTPEIDTTDDNKHLRYADLRLIGSLLPADEASLLAYARALGQWHLSHRYCSRCGGHLLVREAGHVQICSDSTCALQLFPRVDPAIIVLAARGDCALLGREASWPKGRYSTLAGFVEPGESLEDAVAREVMEESGIEVGQIRYHSSQPWPFPQSLMLGFSATALSHDIQLRDGELEEALWVSVDDIVELKIGLPTPLSISYRLVEDWFDGVSDTPLAEIRARRHKAQ